MKSRLKTILAVSFLIAATLALTWPVAGRMTRAVCETGDTLLNTWILASNADKIASLEFTDLFNTTMFHPHRRTLAYSELMIPQSLVALPVLKLTGNPILAYNVVFLFSMALSAIGMFLLARRLTGNLTGSLVAGMIFAFCPFMMAHLPHLQIYFAGGIPLTFLFMHRYFASERPADMVGAALCFAMQALANSYYAMYLTLFAAIGFAWHLAHEQRFMRPRIWLHLAMFAVIAAALVGPFFYQYHALRGETSDFVRVIGFQATLKSYLAVPPGTRIYQRWLARFGTPEAHLFPGLTALVLAAIGVIGWRRGPVRSVVSEGRAPLWIRSIRTVVDILLICAVGVILAMAFTGGFRFSVGPIRVSSHRYFRVLIALMIMVPLRFAVNVPFRRRAVACFRRMHPAMPLYSTLLILAFLFTFGTEGPYQLLYDYVPGFNGLRVASRFAVMVMMGLALLAAFGVDVVTQWVGARWRWVFVLILPVLVGAEYVRAPLSSVSVPTGDAIPPVYRWLVAQPDHGPIAHLPIPRPGPLAYRPEVYRAYYSIFHRQPMVNGYSGYMPPLYYELERRLREEPLAVGIQALRSLGVRYVLVHHRDFRPLEFHEFMNQTDALPENSELKFAGQFRDVSMYALAPDADIASQRTIAASHALPREGWHATANVAPETAMLALDGDPETRWTTGPQKIGHQFIVDLGQETAFDVIQLSLSGSPSDYPRGCRVECSSNGTMWTLMADMRTPLLPIRAFLHPRELSYTIAVPEQRARFIRLTNTGSDPVYYWSIHEFELLGHIKESAPPRAGR